MEKEVKVTFSPEAEEVYNYLREQSPSSKTERTILDALHNKIELIKIDMHYGNPIAKNLIPDEYRSKYGISNLFRVELPMFWRMLYTLTAGETKIEIVAFILEIMDHKDYNKRLGYKNR
ncbi:hypothetical protein GF345_06260 [Candidatus Woesearchaeota archaeon]|nr:hypothetical protein [Candidatus Woesearchaeota archaeon]